MGSVLLMGVRNYVCVALQGCFLSGWLAVFPQQQCGKYPVYALCAGSSYSGGSWSLLQSFFCTLPGCVPTSCSNGTELMKHGVWPMPCLFSFAVLLHYVPLRRDVAEMGVMETTHVGCGWMYVVCVVGENVVGENVVQVGLIGLGFVESQVLGV